MIKLPRVLVWTAVLSLPLIASERAAAQFWSGAPAGVYVDDGPSRYDGVEDDEPPRRGRRTQRYSSYRDNAPPLDGQYVGGGYGGSLSSYPDDYGVDATEQEVPAQFRRQTVSYPGKQAPGTIVIDTRRKFLYLVQGNGSAVRYGIGVGREGFTWQGVQTISMKREWPSWRPPAEMRKRRPDLPVFMEGGTDNPLGARALYLGSTLYRIHGTNEPNTIGRNVSSGCIRLTNDDVMDLYSRVGVGTRVVVM